MFSFGDLQRDLERYFFFFFFIEIEHCFKGFSKNVTIKSIRSLLRKRFCFIIPVTSRVVQCNIGYAFKKLFYIGMCIFYEKIVKLAYCFDAKHNKQLITGTVCIAHRVVDDKSSFKNFACFTSKN